MSPSRTLQVMFSEAVIINYASGQEAFNDTCHMSICKVVCQHTRLAETWSGREDYNLDEKPLKLSVFPI